MMIAITVSPPSVVPLLSGAAPQKENFTVY